VIGRVRALDSLLSSSCASLGKSFVEKDTPLCVSALSMADVIVMVFVKVLSAVKDYQGEWIQRVVNQVPPLLLFRPLTDTYILISG